MRINICAKPRALAALPLDFRRNIDEKRYPWVISLEVTGRRQVFYLVGSRRAAMMLAPRIVEETRLEIESMCSDMLKRMSDYVIGDGE
jgi:hypothetical protein